MHTDNQIKTHELIVFPIEKCETEIRNLFNLTKRDTWISIFSKISLWSSWGVCALGGAASVGTGLYRARLLSSPDGQDCGCPVGSLPFCSAVCLRPASKEAPYAARGSHRCTNDESQPDRQTAILVQSKIS